jgi:hypothetical protein
MYALISMCTYEYVYRQAYIMLKWYQVSAAVQMSSLLFWDFKTPLIGGYLPTLRDNVQIPSSKISSLLGLIENFAYETNKLSRNTGN